MDPVQLMMAAHQADATVAAQTPDQALQAAIAQSRPDLWAPLSTNPAAYPDLLGWLASTGNVEVLANLRARGYLTDDAAAYAAGTAGSASMAAAAGGEPAAEPPVVQEAQARTESAEPAGDGTEVVDEVEAETAEEPEPAEDSDAEAVEPAKSEEDSVVVEPAGEGGAEGAEAAEGAEVEEPAEIDEPAKDAEGDEVEDRAAQDRPAEDAEGDAPADEPGAEAVDAAEEPESGESDDEDTDVVTGEADDETEGADDESDETGDEQETEESVEDAKGHEAESQASQDQSAEDAAGGAPADEPGAEAVDAAEEPESGESDDEDTDVVTGEADDEAEGAADEAEGALADGEPEAGEATEAENAEAESTEAGSAELEDNEPVDDDPTVLTPVSQWHEVDSADTSDVTAAAQSAAAATGWTAGSAAPAAGSAEPVALPVPPPPSAEDIAAWAETPSGAPSGFSAAQPAVELDMFGPQMMAQMPPPQQQRQPSRSSSGRLIAIIVVLLLVIVGGGGVWAGTYFANKGKSDSSQDKADGNGDKGGEQNGQADAAATSTAAALPSGAVKACSSMPTFTITSVEDGQGELKVHGNMATSCAEGDFLAGSSSQVLVYSSTSPTGGADVDHLVASGTFDLSSDPLIIPNGGRAVTLRFGEQHYFRTAKDLDLKGLSVRPSFDRGSPSSATAKSSTNSPMTIASSTSSNANQEAQDEQAAGEAIQWQVKHDYPLVKERLLHQWTPQLSSKQVGLVADGQTWTNRSILAEYLRIRQDNPNAVIIDTSQWPVYDVNGWWVTLQGERFGEADQANAWCDAQGYDSDHCLAKRIESNGTSQGTTKLR